MTQDANDQDRSFLQRLPLLLFVLVILIATTLTFATGFISSIVVLTVLGLVDATWSNAAVIGSSIFAAIATLLLLARARKHRSAKRPHANSDQIPWPTGDAPQGTPSTPSKPRRTARNLAIWLTISVALLGLSVLIREQGGDLKVVLNDGMVLNVWNVGHSPIEITSIAINDRTDCKLRTGLFVGEDFSPVRLLVGDRQHWFSSCTVIRATIRTDKGVNVFNFD